MSNYQNVIDTIQQHNLSWADIDRILLNADTYDELQSRASFEVCEHPTTNKPSVREVSGDEQIMYVSEGGSLVTIEL